MPNEIQFSYDTIAKGDEKPPALSDFEAFDAVSKGGVMGALKAIQDMAAGAAAPKMQPGMDLYNNNRQILDRFKIFSGEQQLELTPLPELESHKTPEITNQ